MTELSIENVQDYPRPPELERVRQRLVVRLGGGIAADTVNAYRVLETHHAPTYYFPIKDVFAKLEPVPGQSFCEWKGIARYFDVLQGGAIARRAAWTYDTPSPTFRPVAGYVAFYAASMDACFVGSERASPQPGSFYGGWVTPNLQGIPKGSRGTEHW